MTGCVNHSAPQFKALSKVFGKNLADAFTRGYSKNVKGMIEGFYIPSVNEVKKWLTADKAKIPDFISRALVIEPLMKDSAIKAMLSGVVHTYQGQTFLTSGPINMSGVNKNEVRDTIYRPNLKVMRELETKHPSIFRVVDTNKEFRKIVEITPLQEGEQKILFQKRGAIQMTEASAKTLNIIKDFINRIGVDIKTMQEVGGKKYDADAVAMIMQNIIAVTEGSEASQLPEEAMHFAVEIIKQKNPQLYKKLLKEINNYNILQMVFNDYAGDSDYQTKDGKPDVIKLKEEAIAKVLAETVIRRSDNIIESNELLSKSLSWWEEIIQFIKELFNTSGFDKAAMSIISGRFEGSAEDIKSAEEKLFFQKSKQDEVFDTFRDIHNRMTPADNEGDGKYSIDGRKISKRVTDIAKSWITRMFEDKKLVDSDYTKALANLKAEKGTQGHKAFEYAFHKLVDENGYLRDDVLDESDYSIHNPEFDWDFYVILRNNLKERLESLDNQREIGRTRFMAEVMVYDPNRDIAGTIDLLVIKPDGKVSIYDWKFKALNTDKFTDIPWYDIKSWNTQMGQYKQIVEKAYKVEEFEQTRMIPVQATYTQGRPKDGILPKLQEIKIGDVNVKNIEEDYLLPVALENEKTGNKQIDKLLDQLNSTYKKISEREVGAEDKRDKAEQLNSLFKAIRHLQIKQDIEPLIDQSHLIIKEAERVINKYKTKFEGKDAKLFSDKERNQMSKEINDIIDIIEKYTTMDVQLKSVFTGDEYKQLIEKLSKAGDEARRMVMELNEVQVDLVAEHIAKSEKVEDYMAPEKTIHLFTKLFISTSGLQHKGIQLLFKKANKAISKASFDTMSEMKRLGKIKEGYDKWAKGRGLSVRTYFDIIKKKDKNELIDEFNPEFYKQLKQKIQDRDYKWVRENVDVPAYREHLKEKLDKEIEWIRTRTRLEEGEEAQKQITREIKRAESLFDISTAESPGWLLYNNIRMFPKRDLWESEQWIELNKPENKPAKEFYDYIIERNKEYQSLGYISNARTFLPFVRKKFLESLVTKGDIRFGESFFRSISIDEGDIGYGKRDPDTGELVNSIPKYYTREIDGEVSDDLFRTMHLYNEAALKYKYLSEIEEQIIALTKVERNKQTILTSTFGKTQKKNGQIQYNKDNRKNSQLLEDMQSAIVYGQRYIRSETVDQLLFKIGKWGDTFNKTRGMKIFPENLSERQLSVNKIITSLNNFFQLNVLGLNVLSAGSNSFGGNSQSLINAGYYFRRRDYVAANLMAFQNRFDGTNKKKMLAAFEYFLPLTENYNIRVAKNLSVNTLTQESLQDGLMILMRNSDWQVQTANFYAYLMNSIVQDGQVVNVREYLRSLPEYENKYKLSGERRKEVDRKFEEDVKKLVEEKGVLKVGKVENGEFVIPGVDRHSDSVIELRRKVQFLSKSALGNLSEDDVRRMNLTVYGRSFMMFKNWIPRLIDVRIGNLKYNAASDAYEWGRTRNVMRILVQDGLLKGLDNLYSSLAANEKGIDYLRQLYEKKKADYEADTNKILKMTETEFIDLVRQNIKGQMIDVIFLSTMFSMLALLKSVDTDDEDPIVTNQYRFMVRAIDKFSGELSYFYDPSSFTSFLGSSLLPTMGLVDNFRKAIKNFLIENWALATGDEETVEDTYVIKYWMRSFPFTNQMVGYLPMFYPELAKELGIRVQSNYGIGRR